MLQAISWQQLPLLLFSLSFISSPIEAKPFSRSLPHSAHALPAVSSGFEGLDGNVVGLNFLATKYTDHGYKDKYEPGEWPWSERVHVLRHLIIDYYDADLVAASEFSFDIFDDMAKLFPDYALVGPEIPAYPGGVGFKCYVMFKRQRYQLVKSKIITFPAAKNAMMVRLYDRWTSDYLIFAAVHMYGNNGDAQAKRLKKFIDKWLKRNPDDKVIIAGDFNMRPWDQGSKYLRRFYKDTYLSKYNSHAQDHDRVDYIYIENHDKSEVFSAEINEEAYEGTDHPAVMAEVNLYLESP